MDQEDYDQVKAQLLSELSELRQGNSQVRAKIDGLVNLHQEVNSHLLSSTCELQQHLASKADLNPLKRPNSFCNVAQRAAHEEHPVALGVGIRRLSLATESSMDHMQLQRLIAIEQHISVKQRESLEALEKRGRNFLAGMQSQLAAQEALLREHAEFLETFDLQLDNAKRPAFTCCQCKKQVTRLQHPGYVTLSLCEHEMCRHCAALMVEEVFSRHHCPCYCPACNDPSVSIPVDDLLGVLSPDHVDAYKRCLQSHERMLLSKLQGHKV